MFTATLFREVPKVVAEGMSAAAFRHGLREMIKPDHRVVIFAPDGKTQPYLFGMAEDSLEIGVPVLLITNTEPNLPPRKELLVYQTKHLPEPWSPVYDMVPLQLTGYQLARRRGLEPGKLITSSYITTVE